MRRSLWFLAIVLSLAVSPVASVTLGQALSRQPTAFTAYLDFSRASTELPIWIERVDKQVFQTDAGQPEKTVYRVRFRRFPGLVDEVLMRVYFEDQPGAQPIVTGWSEIGTLMMAARTLGQGLGLPSSETIRIPMAGIDYVDIETPGSGGTVRGVLAVALRQTETREGVDFGGTPEVGDPFGNGSPAVTGSDDVLLFGRVKATLDPGVIPLGNGDDAGEVAFDFPLERPPLIGLVTFEILNADISAPPELLVNGKEIDTCRMRIYNRWGQLVFETNSQEKGWDGKTNDQPQPDDIYVYLVQAVFIDGTKKNIQGNVKFNVNRYY